MSQYPQQTNSSTKTVYTILVVIFYLLAIALLAGAIAVTVNGYILVGLYVASAVWFIIASGFAIKRYRMGNTGTTGGLQHQQPYMVGQQYAMPEFSNQSQPPAFKQGPQAHTYQIQVPPGQVPTQYQQSYPQGNLTYQLPPQVNMGYQDTRVFEQTLR